MSSAPESMNFRTLPFSLVDVFAREPLTGNGLSVFVLDAELPTLTMHRFTLRYFQINI
jgi:trans-2,3-dihydro-3-hydroxyanthranilate isomerase